MHSDGIEEHLVPDCEEFRKVMLSWFDACRGLCERLLVRFSAARTLADSKCQRVQALLLDEAGMSRKILSAHSQSDHVCEAKSDFI